MGPKILSPFSEVRLKGSVPFPPRLADVLKERLKRVVVHPLRPLGKPGLVIGVRAAVLRVRLREGPAVPELGLFPFLTGRPARGVPEVVALPTKEILGPPAAWEVQLSTPATTPFTGTPKPGAIPPVVAWGVF